jgi:hypothetical protein
MLCGVCERKGVESEMKPGKAIIPCAGKRDGLYYSPAPGIYGSVTKCGQCGHSVQHHGLLRRVLPGYRAGYVYVE